MYVVNLSGSHVVHAMLVHVVVNIKLIRLLGWNEAYYFAGCLLRKVFPFYLHELVCLSSGFIESNIIFQ